MADRVELVHEWPDQSGYRVVEEDDLVLGVVGDVGELFGEEPKVQRVRHPSAAGWGEVELEVACGVPGERGDPPVFGDAEVVERTTEPSGALAPLTVGEPLPPCRRGGHDLLSGMDLRGTVEQVDQRQRGVHHQAVHGGARILLEEVLGGGSGFGDQAEE